MSADPTSSKGPVSSVDPTSLGTSARLEELVDRKGLAELASTFFSLFGISLRFFGADGTLLADAVEEQDLCKHLNTLPGGRVACARPIDAVKRLSPGEGSVTHPCFSGAVYHIVNIEYDHRSIGRVIIGPYLPVEVRDPPASLLAIDPGMTELDARERMPRMPRVRKETIQHIAEHVRATLDLILFAGHKALLTSQMHLASVTESYRVLEERNVELQEAVDRLRELDRLKSNFLATVSHELRTPLTSIIGYSEMLSEGIAGPLAPEQKEFVSTIREKGEQLLSLIMNLLDLSKLESGTMQMRRTQVEVDGVLAQVVSTLLPTARKKGVVLESRAEAGLPSLLADAEKLRQVFLNLTENALKFTPQGGTVRLVARSVTRSAADDDDSGFILVAPTMREVEIRVEDSGIGIPIPERAKVFDPFYQVDSSSTREYGGTGLGLSIVKRLVEAHDGHIGIEGNSPKGTVFVVSLPYPQ